MSQLENAFDNDWLAPGSYLVITAGTSTGDELGELWDGKFDIFYSHGLYWARSTTDSVRLAADTAKGLQALLAKIA